MSISNWGINNTWSLFLDRDGVINKRIFGGYVTSIEEFEFLPGAVDAIKQFTDTFHLLFVVTNQQGIAKGIMSERNLLEIHNYMCDQVYLNGGRIDKCYFAPNLKGAEDDMRKPSSAMADLAKMEFPEIDFKCCVMIGDTDTDIEFGKNLGMKTVRIKTEEPINIDADVTVSGLDEFAKMIKNEI